MDNTTLFGAIGSLLVLIAFIMNQIDQWKNDDIMYDIFNFIGSSILVAYAIIIESYPFVVLNLVWVFVSLADSIKDIRSK